MTTSQRGIDLIKILEGLRLKAYQDQGGVWTIGYGHTGQGVHEGLTITKEIAESLLKVDLMKFERIVNREVKAPLTQNQFDSLVSFVYNVGPGKPGEKDGFIWLKDGRHSTILRKLNQEDYSGASLEFEKWAHVVGKDSVGLLRRRKAERDLFVEA